MSARLVDARDPALAAIEQLLIGSHHLKLSTFGALSPEATLVTARFREERPDAFGIFRNYRDPGLHVGSHIQLDRIRDILEMETVGLYQIALLHAEVQTELVQATEELVGAFESWLGQKYERYCLFITLMRKGNRPARPLYRKLGFKKAGRPSALMRFSLDRSEWFLKALDPLPAELSLRFFDEIGEPERVSLADCYRRVFLGDASPDPEEVLKSLLSYTASEEFDNSLSCLLLETGTARVVGFMLAQRSTPDQAHIAVVGLLPEYRGQRLLYRCSSAVAQRARAGNLVGFTFVTSQSRVVRLALRAFGAQEIDELQTYLKVG